MFSTKSLLAIAIVGGVITAAQAAPLTITNPSFEDGTTGWSGSFGTIREAATAGEFGYPAPDGDDVKFTWSSTQNSWQVLDDTLAANTTYTLQMDVMHGAGGEAVMAMMLVLGYGTNGPGGAGSVELARIENGDTGAEVPPSDAPADRVKTWTLTFTTAATAPAGEGEKIWIQLGPDGTSHSGRSGYDNVRLDGTLVPEPASLALLGLGGLVIARRRR